MTPKAADALTRLSRLLTYPEAGYAADLDALVDSLADWERRAAHELGNFGDRINGLGLPDVQELFTRTFDLNPVCALEVGWHLFGEEYERGTFLVRMRQALREHGISENGELPDHLAAMLLLVTKLDAEEADLLIVNALVPAIDKMLDPLEKSESPFFPLVKAIRHVFGACAPVGVIHA